MSRITTLENIIKSIDENKAGAVDAYREHIKGKIQRIFSVFEASISEDRFLQEIALLADKTDITERLSDLPHMWYN